MSVSPCVTERRSGESAAKTPKRLRLAQLRMGTSETRPNRLRPSALCTSVWCRSTNGGSQARSKRLPAIGKAVGDIRRLQNGWRAVGDALEGVGADWTSVPKWETSAHVGNRPGRQACADVVENARLVGMRRQVECCGELVPDVKLVDVPWAPHQPNMWRRTGPSQHWHLHKKWAKLALR